MQVENWTIEDWEQIFGVESETNIVWLLANCKTLFVIKIVIKIVTLIVPSRGKSLARTHSAVAG